MRHHMSADRASVAERIPISKPILKLPIRAIFTNPSPAIVQSALMPMARGIPARTAKSTVANMLQSANPNATQNSAMTESVEVAGSFCVTITPNAAIAAVPAVPVMTHGLIRMPLV